MNPSDDGEVRSEDRTRRPTARVRLRSRICILTLSPVGLAAAWCGIAWGADPAPAPDAAFLAQQKAHVEDQTAGLIQQRPEPPAMSPVLEFQIDLRVIDRWLLDRAANAAEASRERVNDEFRATQLQAIIGDVDAMLSRTALVLTPQQEAALRNLHGVTYTLGDMKAPAAADEVSAGVGIVLLNLAGGQGRAVPLMRPKAGQGQENKDAAAAPRSLADLADAAAQANVPPALHRQLVLLANTARVGGNGNDAPDAQKKLEESVGLIEALAAVPAASADVRDSVQSQLADGVALYLDRRTRAAGENRLASLRAYRAAFARIGKVQLPKDLSDPLAPALAYAAKNPQDAEHVLKSIGRYVEAGAKLDARPAVDPGPAFRRSADELRSQLSAARQAFLTDAAALGTTGGVGQLDARIDELVRLSDTLDAVERLPQTLETLAAYKPRPFGALEKHAAVAATAAAGSSSSSSSSSLSARADAGKFVADLTRLADDAAALARHDPEQVPPDVLKLYVGGSLKPLDQKWRLVVADQTSSAAGPGVIDRGKLARLDAVRALMDALDDAASCQAALAKLPALQRWVDWQITPEQADAVLTPYRQATAAAVSGYVSDDAAPLDAWAKARQRYAPLLRFFVNAAAYADACAALPTGLTGDAAKLITPIYGQPFATERFASVSLTLWSADAPSDAAVLDELGKRVR